MAPIKGWSKKTQHDGSTWQNKNNTITLLDNTRLNGRGGFSSYEIDIYVAENQVRGSYHINKGFKTKQQARDYAIRYMRTHPRG